ncbi:PREDICTED: probable phospholipid-transporting ATPase IK [Galeopterus variegatus]|uniref:Phospholipid-transporting ATPase n=1 Tax=Galeopterus variegatus TaxID=482537 RepID=A0ABM0RFM2_GALVR|nr:PREDICTED: probable phospholipid-transporting ATPase IK [Galeopterus variegatus]
MGSVTYGEGLEDDRNSALTWEVRANNRAYHAQVEKVFLCWRRRKYKTNVIHTAKYNVFSFLPLNLYEQFHRVSNLYFLLVIVLQSVPEVSTLPWVTLFAPLLCLVLIRATRDLVDDIGRHRSDKAINNRPCQVLMGKSFTQKKWKNLHVGDVVRLRRDSIVPADLLLLASTEPSSLCYVETADIDGETNLKFRQALMVTHHQLTSARRMASFQGTVLCEKPNSRMHHFVGCLEWNHEKYPLDIGNLLLRGCKIRNTDTCYGLVIYAGFDTKIMKNCGKIHQKRTKMDLLMNRLVILMFLSLVIISLALTLGFSFKVREFREKHYYISAQHGHHVAMESFLIFCSFVLLLSVMLPIAMFIIAEFIYLGNSVFINWDLRMYHEPQDVPAEARSTSLSDQLGRVEYVFSDKTGTLTQNVLRFSKCCINGRVYGGAPPHRPPGPEDRDGIQPQENPYLWNKLADGKLRFHNEDLLHVVRHNRDRVVREFWRLLAICHTVMAHQEKAQLLYQAASPDEEALVTAARNFGYVFLSRTQDTITLMELGVERVYQVLAMMDFNSVRKRMSVLVRNPEGFICLYTKGADTVILERLHKKYGVEVTTEEALAAFAQETLRTLCLAYKEVDEDVYQEWRQRHQEASILLQNRAQALHQVYNEMEQNLKLLGVTAIEDRLQDGVPDTIKCLKKGNIKVWVLTGDKQETAVNIGFACELLSENMLILEEKEIVRILEAYWEGKNDLLTRKGCLKFMPHTKLAMVINGDFLDQLLLTLRNEPRALVHNVNVEESRQEPGHSRRDFLQARRISLMWRNFGAQLGPTQPKTSNTHESPEVRRERAFVDLASRCQAVICCRVTPKQKALVVALVKKYQQVVTLAVGDGANDVNMIKTADIGVGLTGQEGTQAAQNSDYTLAQFCFLQQLLLVHGRWSYVRVCKFLRYFIYKTLASMLAQIWFAFYSGFSAQPLYEGWFLALFNLLYSTLPVLYIGLFEQDVSATQSLEMPELYMAGQKDELFNYWVFLQAIAHGTVTSLVNFFVPLWVSHDTAGPSTFSDYQSFAVVVGLSGLLSVTMEVILIIKYWTVLCGVTILFGFCAYFVMSFASQSYLFYKISPQNFPFLYADRNVLSHPSILLVVLLNVSLNTLPALAVRIVHRSLKKPRPKEEEEAPGEEVAAEPVPHFHRESRRRRSSYAFSHHEGYAHLITQGTILRKSPETSDDDGVSDAPVPSEEELPSSRKASLWHPRSLSLGGKKRRQHRAKGSSEEAQPPATGGSVMSEHGPSTPYLKNQTAVTNKLPTSLSSLYESFQEESSVTLERPPSSEQRPPSPERLLSTKERSPSLHIVFREPSITLGNRPWSSELPQSSEEKLSCWRASALFWKSGPYIWEKQPHPSKEGTVPLPSKPHTSVVETALPSTADPSLNQQPVAVEPWPAERQPSPVEWLPAPTQDQSLPSSKGQSSTSFPFPNKPGSV